jgi:hypothetical protein
MDSHAISYRDITENVLGGYGWDYVKLIIHSSYRPSSIAGDKYQQEVARLEQLLIQSESKVSSKGSSYC